MVELTLGGMVGSRQYTLKLSMLEAMCFGIKIKEKAEHSKGHQECRWGRGSVLSRLIEKLHNQDTIFF